MVLRVCLGCTALFPPGLGRCPQCGQEDHVEQGSAEDPTALTEEDDVPKISAAGGATIAGVPGMDNQSDREEDQSRFMADPESGGIPSRADRIEQAESDRAAGRDAEEGDQPGKRGNQGQQAEDYAGYTYNALQGLCKERGLPATGSHGELVNRLQDHDQRGERG